MCHDPYIKPQDPMRIKGFWLGILVSIPLWCVILIGIIILKETLGHGH